MLQHSSETSAKLPSVITDLICVELDYYRKESISSLGQVHSAEFLLVQGPEQVGDYFTNRRLEIVLNQNNSTSILPVPPAIAANLSKYIASQKPENHDCYSFVHYLLNIPVARSQIESVPGIATGIIGRDNWDILPYQENKLNNWDAVLFCYDFDGYIQPMHFALHIGEAILISKAFRDGPVVIADFETTKHDFSGSAKQFICRPKK